MASYKWFIKTLIACFCFFNHQTILKHMNLKQLSLIFLFSWFVFVATAQIQIVKDGKPQSRILVDTGNATDVKAAKVLQDFVNRISGAELKIVPANSKLQKGDILIGGFQLPLPSYIPAQIHEDGFFLSSRDGYVRIIGGAGDGTIYGVVTLLEDFFDVHYYAKDACTFTVRKSLTLPNSIHKIENPSFRFRQTQAYSLRDSLYGLWHRLEEPRDMFAANLWVHTFNRILPASEFGASHPEYFAYINGARRPGTASQWCLTNDELFEIVAHRVDSIFKANPGKNMISISQNDSQNHCECDHCKKIDDEEGSPSGTLVYFLNKLAARFPDKEFSTLAYLYSVPPPKHLKPLPNVNIMLCNIECFRELPLTETVSGKKFVNDMEGWAKISNNIFVWDYGINFDNYISPFPNFHVLQPNMQLFQKNHATMHFSQIGGVKGGDFSELRSYIVAKLLWNTSVNVDSVMQSFLKGYYGEAAAPFLYQYLKLQEGALIGSRIPLWIYDTPITHKTGMLNKGMMKRYKELFDQAEKAVSGNPTYLNRVRESRLPIQYAELEIARTEPIKDTEYIKSQLALFEQRAKEFGITTLNEKRNTIEKYCKLYAQRNFPSGKKNFAFGAKVEFMIPPSAPYDKIGNTALTDGLYGGATFNDGWVGWIDKDAEFVVDLGETQRIDCVEVDLLNHLGAWILLPKSVSCYTSQDNKNFDLMGQRQIPEDRETEIKYVPVAIQSASKIPARYIKIKVESIGLCPPWHYGVGFPAWFFLDEVTVY